MGDGCLFKKLSTLVFETRFLTEQSTVIQLTWQVQISREPPLSSFPVCGLQECTVALAFHMGDGCLNSEIYACLASTLQTELSSQFMIHS